jgi:hypothetical protein
VPYASPREDDEAAATAAAAAIAAAEEAGTTATFSIDSLAFRGICIITESKRTGAYRAFFVARGGEFEGGFWRGAVKGEDRIRGVGLPAAGTSFISFAFSSESLSENNTGCTIRLMADSSHLFEV